jgi:hypothetical protein
MQSVPLWKSQQSHPHSRRMHSHSGMNRQIGKNPSTINLSGPQLMTIQVSKE